MVLVITCYGHLFATCIKVPPSCDVGDIDSQEIEIHNK